MASKKQYTNTWFAERGGKTWDKLLEGLNIENALEIGCYEGQASVFILDKFPDSLLDVSDIFEADKAEDWDGYVDEYEKRFDNNIKPYKARVTKHKGKSFNTLAQMIVDNYLFDFIFVDGDHRKLPATQDMAMAIELLNDKGVMVIDDYKEIPWLFDAVNAFSNTLDSEKYSWGTTSDGEQFVIRRK